MGVQKQKTLKNHYDLKGLIRFELNVVEPERIELSSREDQHVLSTMLS